VRARAAGGVQWMKGERQCMQCVEAIEPVSRIRRPMSGRLADRLLVVWCLLTAAHRASASTWQPHTRRRRQRRCANVDAARKGTIARAVRPQRSESRDGETNREGRVVSACNAGRCARTY